MARVVELSDVTKTYRAGALEVPALRGISLAIERGELTALVGPSGSGKSTLMHLIGGLDTPTSGRVIVSGVDLSRMSPRALSDMRLRQVGFVFQAYNLVPVLSAAENVELVLELQGVRRGARRKRALEVLSAVGLGDLADRRPAEMSGGQQQRVAVGRAIVAEPGLVLADEPTANLDSTTGEELLDLMERLNRELGITFLFATHDPKVMAHARRIVTLVDGRIERDEPRAKSAA